MLALQKSLAFFVMLIVFTPLSAQDLDIPAGVTVVTAPEVRQMVTNGNVLLVHTLSRIEYQMQHIPNSINIPVDEIAHSTSMPTHKDMPIIFYCNGLACPYSKRASKIAVQQGYSNVFWFRGGILEWRKFQYKMETDEVLKNIKVEKLNPEDFLKAALKDVLILDVRPRWWRQSDEHAGVIEGTGMMIPLLDLDRHIDQLPKDRPILVVDRLMRQSTHAAKYLKNKGLNIIGVLKGGAKRWVAEGRPVLAKQDEPPMITNTPVQ